MRRHRIAATFVALAAVALGCTQRAEPTSVLLVTLDTLRVDHVGAYGAPPGTTPHLDALARDGIVHDAAYTTMPTTGPAHISLFTGLAPRHHGADRNGVPLDPKLRDRELAARLRAAGYATAAFVTTRILDRSVTGLEGFEIYDGTADALRPGQQAVAAALRWLDVERRRPVFLWVHLYDPHAPYGTAAEKPAGFPLRPDEYGWIDVARYAEPSARAQHREAYVRGVREADAAFGALVDGVRARVAGPLLVAAVADHGEALDEWIDTRRYGFDHGEFLDADQIRIPLVIAGAGVAPARSTGAVSISDLYGTLLAVAGVAEPESAATRDLRVASAAPRVVVTERRAEEGSGGAPDARASAALRAHAVAATDGTGLAVVAADGSASEASGAPSLADAARAALSEFPARRTAAPEVDAATREALRSLGYAP